MSFCVKAYIGLGANLGNPTQQLAKALQYLSLADGIQVVALSSIYESTALPMPDDGGDLQSQPNYLNAVAELRTSLPCHWLLRKLMQIENRLGRVRKERWGPRTLDLDILLYGQQRIKQKALVVPHSEIHKRAFVLYPLREITQNLTIPGVGILQRLVQQCDKTGLNIYRKLNR